MHEAVKGVKKFTMCTAVINSEKVHIMRISEKQ